MGIGVLLAKSGLPTGEISVYETLIFLSNLVSFFWIVGGMNAFLQFFPTLSATKKKKAIFNIFFLFLLLSVLGASVLFFNQSFLFERFNHGEELPYFSLICLYIIFNTPTLLVHYYYLLLDDFRSILWFGGIIFSIQVMVICLPIYFGLDLSVSFWGLLIFAQIKFLYCLYLVVKHGALCIDIDFIKKYSQLATPLILYILVGSSVEYIDGLIVKYQFTDERTFAIFRYGAREFPISLLLVTALVSALIPAIATKKSAALPLIKQKTSQLMNWIFPISALLMLLSPILFPLVYNADFQVSADIFNVYLLILCSRILLPHALVMGFQKNYILVVSAILETIVNVALSLLLVQSYGLVGIAFASLVAYFFNKMLLIIYCHVQLKIALWEYIYLPKYLLFCALLFGSYFLANQLY